MRTYIRDINTHIGEEIICKGWISVRRDQGKMVFFDLRDYSGEVQAVVLPNHEEAIAVAKEIRPEWVVEVRALVNKRPERNIKEGVLNGDVELEVLGITVLNKAETPPFEITEDTSGVNEDVRLKYRYLDLRTKRMQNNIRKRGEIISFFRNHMSQNDFLEIETPMLIKGTPEGSREYIVPSRMWTGTFYALPQSPQQFKQLTMVAGFEKYYQIARCMRDEDLRGDRQPEFTQLDYEMSFVTEEDVMNYTEKMTIGLIKALYPEKNIQETPFPRITYKESMEKYGNDKPDLRKNPEDENELAFCWVTDFPMFEKGDDGKLQAVHHPFTAVKEEDRELLETNPTEARAQAYDLVLNGNEIGGGSIRIHQRDLQNKIFELLGLDEETIEKRFGHMLTAFTYGAPPHGGLAWGLERFIMVLQNEPNIREVMAFPKTGEGKDLMMEAPSEVPKEQLDELGIELKKGK